VPLGTAADDLRQDGCLATVETAHRSSDTG